MSMILKYNYSLNYIYYFILIMNVLERKITKMLSYIRLLFKNENLIQLIEGFLNVSKNMNFC